MIRQCRDCGCDLPEGCPGNTRYCAKCAAKRHSQWKRHAPAERLDLRHAEAQRPDCERRGECLRPVRGVFLTPPCDGCRRYVPPMRETPDQTELRRLIAPSRRSNA